MSQRAESIAHALGGAKKTSDGWLCRCPCHDDRSASLSLKVTDSGGIVLNCFAGCDWQDIKSEIERRGLIEKPRKSQDSRPEAIYDYTDADGKLLFQKIRMPGKSFFNRRPDGAGGWINDLKTVNEKPLFNLPAITAAIKSGQPIAILEGEKDAQNFQKCTGIPATTNFDGANKSGKWKEHYSKSLTDAEIFLLYDNDEPGIIHRDSLVRSLIPYARSITIAHLPSVKTDENGTSHDVKDFSDWYNAGGTADEFYHLNFEVKKTYEPPVEEHVNANTWLEQPEILPEQLLINVFDKGDKIVIIGKSKTRKSFFTQQLAFSLATGRSFLEFPAQNKCKVLVIQSEIKKERYHMRCRRMAERLGIEPYELDSLIIVNARGCASLQDLVERQAVKHNPDVIIVDPFYKLIQGDENKSEDIKPILKVFDALAEKTGAAIIYVHHDKKGSAGETELTDRGSGSGLLARDFDSAVFLAAHESEEDSLVVEFITRNYQSPAAFVVEWSNYCFNKTDKIVKKKTARSKAVKTKLPELLRLAKSLLRAEWAVGTRTMQMATFNLKLSDCGIGRDCHTAVKEGLVSDGWIQISTRKAAPGEGCKIVTLVEQVENEVGEGGSDGEYNSDTLF